MHGTGSRNRLTPHQLDLYPGSNLFARLAQAICKASVLPRKELHEAWEVARLVRRRFRGGRVVDLACGHGLLAHVMLLLDDTAPTALAVDTRLTRNHEPLSLAIVDAWPRLQGKVEFREARLQDIELFKDDVVVSAHACGSLTDDILERARSVGARVAVLPCCQELRDRGDLFGWLDGSLAVDVERATKLRAAGYRIWTQAIPAEISPKNRLLMGAAIGSPLRVGAVQDAAAGDVDDDDAA